MVTTVTTGNGLLTPGLLGYSKVAKNVEDSSARLYSGKRILRNSDDASAVSVATRLQTQIAKYRQAVRDVTTSDTLVGVAKDGLEKIRTKLEEAGELANTANSSTLIAQERALLQQQFAEKLEEIDRLVEETQFNNQKLLDGSFADKDIRVGPEETDFINIAISDVGTDELFGATPPDLATEANAADAETEIADALEAVGSLIGALQGAQGQISSASENISSTLSGVSEAESEITDIDEETAILELAQEQIQLDIGAAVIAQASRISDKLLDVLEFRIEIDRQAELNEAEVEEEVETKEQPSNSTGVDASTSAAAA